MCTGEQVRAHVSYTDLNICVPELKLHKRECAAPETQTGAESQNQWNVFPLWSWFFLSFLFADTNVHIHTHDQSGLWRLCGRSQTHTKKNKNNAVHTSQQTTMRTKTFGPILVSCSHLTEVMIFFRLLEVKSSPLFFTRSCQQVVKHMVVPKERGENRTAENQ